MISIEKCREILGEKAKGMSDEQIRAIRKVLTELAGINIKIIKEHKKSKG